MRAEFEAPERDLSQPVPDFALGPNLKGFKLNPKVARVLLVGVLGIGAASAGAVTGITSGNNVSQELTPGSPRVSLVTDVPITCTLPAPTVEVVNEPPIVVVEGKGPVPLCGNGEPSCPSDQECKITAFQCAPGVTCMSGVCVDKDTSGNH